MKVDHVIHIGLSVRVIKFETLSNGDESAELIITCDGVEIGQLDVSLFEMTSDREREFLIREILSSCFHESIGLLERTLLDKSSDHPNTHALTDIN